jgi:DNA modification methylase
MKNSQETKQRKFSLWKLGDHVLAQGDCRDIDLLKQVIGAAKVNLLCCDVPYGIDVAESKRAFQPLVKDKDIANDGIQSDAAYATFTKEWLGAITPYLAKKNSAYIFNADKMVWALRDGMVASHFKVAQLLIWVKQQSVIGRLDYAPQHELIVYGWHGTHAFHRSKDKSVVYYPRPKRSPFHPTTKPVGLIHRLILNSSKIGDVVYDGFLGSGTTLLACEQTKRRCIGIELDAEYCQTVIKRWEKLTNRKAERVC